jgi:DNA-binding transcriptional LysR family regulator
MFMDKLVALKVFRRVVELGSFSRAADDIGLSNASVSKNVQELEKELKTQLIHRTTRRLSLTETGKLYFQRICHILDELAHAEETVSDLSAKPSGLLRVTVPMSMGLTHVAATIYQFQAVYPDIRIDLVLNDCYVDLIEDGFDVGIRGSGKLNNDSLVRQQICNIQRVVCASPEYLKQHGEPRSPHELEQHNCVIYSLARSPHEWSFQRDDKTVTVNVDGSLKVNNSLAAAQAAVSGLGLLFLPTFAVLDALELGKLQVVLKEWSAEPLILYAVYPKHRQHSRKLQIFVNFISDALTAIFQ